jgi:DUF2934 family protein
MAKSVKKSGAAKKVVAKPFEPAERKPAPKKPIAKKSVLKKPVASANGASSSITHDQVALLAHRFWIERGRKHGHHEEDWFRAEQELRAKAS